MKRHEAAGISIPAVSRSGCLQRWDTQKRAAEPVTIMAINSQATIIPKVSTMDRP
jgi:hypothetical protein